MAKGLRSKSMRKNRSLIRKLVTIPIIEKRRDDLSIKLKKHLEEQNGSTIIGLKGLITGINENKKMQEMEVTNEKDDEADDADEVMSKPSSKGKGKHKSQVHLIKKKGMKAKSNPGKELVWFK
eukprot:gene13295-28155_t